MPVKFEKLKAAVATCCIYVIESLLNEETIPKNTVRQTLRDSWA